jgi:RNA polymerase sigma-70 factor (ECF subfamily)
VQTTVTESNIQNQDFEALVNLYYCDLYRFAFSLTRSETDAWDLTQQTFYLWATKGSQLRDHSKVKAWLFTTLHRAFLQVRRRTSRFSHLELSEADSQLPEILPDQAGQSDWAHVLQALDHLDERFQAPVALFYLGDHTYQEIAQILEVPLGTVKSRIARGLAQLHQYLENGVPELGEENTRAIRPTNQRACFPLVNMTQALV